MRKTTKALTVAVWLSLWGLLPLDGSLYALSASYTFTFQNGVIPPPQPSGPNVIRLFVKAASATAETSYTGNFVFAQGGATEGEVRDLVFADLQGQGWVVTKIGANGIRIDGRRLLPGSPLMPTREIGRGDTHEDITVAYSANVDIDDVAAGQATWGIVIGKLSADAVNPGIIAVTFNNTIEVTAPLSPFDAGEQVVAKLASAMTNAGFQVTPVVTRFGGHVLLNWNNPINFSLLGETVNAVLELRDGAGGPNLLLTLPGAAPSGPPPRP